MRKAALSFSLLLTLLMSLLVAAPAYAASAPASPTGLTATDNACTNAVQLSWIAPAQAVAGYRVHIYDYAYRQNDGDLRHSFQMLELRGQTSVSVNLAGMLNDYYFEVASVTDFAASYVGGDNGDLLVPSGTQSVTATTSLNHSWAVSAPTRLSAAVDASTELVTFRWSKPEKDGVACDVEEYHWTLRSPYADPSQSGEWNPWEDGWSRSSDTSETMYYDGVSAQEFCIFGAQMISPGEDYDYYSHGPAACVIVGDFVVRAPSGPDYVDAEPEGKTSVRVTWSTPVEDGGSAITGYRVGRDGTDASGVGPWSTVVGVDITEQTFTNLRANTRYNFSVRAINAKGESAPSSASVTVDPYVAPSSPTAVAAAVDSSLRTATLSWNTPVWPGYPAITGYRVARNGTDNSGAGPWSTVVAATKRSQTFSNLASGSSYTLSVTAINAGGESLPTKTVVALAGSALTAPTPTIGGTATVGSTLTANAGTWGPAPVALAYQWRANGTAISGATAGTYRLASAEVGKTITVAVTGSKSGYVSTTRVSAATAAVSGGALTAATPTVTGTAKVGSTLTANPGTWGPAPVTFSYQWKADGVALSGATASTYTPSSATLGKKISVTVSGGKTGYTGASRTSIATAAVVAGTFAAVTPTITGTAKVGSTLTAVPGAWGPAPVAFTYQWKANGTALSGATGSSYQPSAATLGKTITVTVSGTKAGYTSATRTSAATAAVASGTLTAVTPKITGTAKVGSTLTATAGTWGPAPVALTYQWKANGTAISGATATTYKPTSATVGKSITVTVTGKKTAYTTATRTSTATAAVVR